VPATYAAISKVFDDVPECVVLDLSRLGFVDSSGLHATLELSKRSAAQKTRLVIIPGPAAVQRIFEITGLLDGLPFIGNPPQASRVSTSSLHRARHLAPGSPSSPPRPPSRRARSAKRRRRPGARSRP
jgi:anti-anti-sigma factor